jgi:hypothetical protein
VDVDAKVCKHQRGVRRKAFLHATHIFFETRAASQTQLHNTSKHFHYFQVVFITILIVCKGYRVETHNDTIAKQGEGDNVLSHRDAQSSSTGSQLNKRG